jgi:hypothetical protein
LLGKKLVVTVPEMSRENFEKLQELHESLAEYENIYLHSIFNHMFTMKAEDEFDSSLIELTNLGDVFGDSFEVFEKYREKFQFYFSDEQVNFYIFSRGELNLDSIPTEFKYEIVDVISDKSFIEEAVLLIGLAVILALLLTIFFHSLSAPILGIIFVVMTSSATIYIFKLFMGDYTPHISILILSFSISFMDYLYIYYRWYMLQQRRNSFYSINRTMERTFSPIFFTTLVNTLGIGSLIFVDSSILQALGFMVIISSIIGLIYSYTFLPLVFSFLNVKDPHLQSENFATFFAEKIKNYSPILLWSFVIVTSFLFLFSAFQFFQGNYHVATDRSSKILKLSLEAEELNLDTLQKLEKISNALNIAEVEKVISPYQAIESLYSEENPDEVFFLDEVDLDRYIFMLDMFGDGESVEESGLVPISVQMISSNEKGKAIDIIKNCEIKGLYILDVDSLLQSAKLETIHTIVALIASILFIIFLVILIMTRKVMYSLIGVIISAIPIIWFFSVITIFQYPLLTEMFVAMVIAVAISSDATIHLLHYYYKLDSENRFDSDGVQKLFLYVESPLILGNMILAITFALMIIANISSIMLIGIFSAIIILLSLITDIFILPVVILESRK